jgi:hypothetical protein
MHDFRLGKFGRMPQLGAAADPAIARNISSAWRINIGRFDVYRQEFWCVGSAVLCCSLEDDGDFSGRTFDDDITTLQR